MEAGEKRILWLRSCSEAGRRACAFARTAAEPHFPSAECSLLEVAVS